MSRYLLSAEARRDLDGIRAYFDGLPYGPAETIARSIQHTFRTIALNPHLGIKSAPLSGLLGQEVRSRLVASYRIFYRVGTSAPEIIAILHTARDIDSIMRARVQ